jgi:hypothetical protein
MEICSLQSQVLKQGETRPKGVGCIFRGSLREAQEPYSVTEFEDLKQSIRYFMDEHRVKGASFIFIGSLWEKKLRQCKEGVALFEASSIELAADIVQLHYCVEVPETTLTEWCYPIYIV